MSRHAKCTASNPITVSEKLNNFEKKFETVVEDVAQLKIELQLSKDQFLDAKKEIAKVKRENDELHSQLLVSAQEIQKIKAEICDLKNKFELEEVNIASAVKITVVDQVNIGSAAKITDLDQVDVESAVKTTDVTLPRKIIQKLPCKTVSELNVLKEDLMRDLGTLIYMVSIV